MIKKSKYPILEFDPSPRAYFNPGHYYSYQGRKFPERVVICFFQDVIAKLIRKHKARKIAMFRSESGFNPAYEITFHHKKIGILHPGIGAPAAAAFLDEAIGMGGKKFIACGGAGVLRQDLAVGHLIIPTSAIRDEGASYHYLPPNREVRPHSQSIRAIRKTLKNTGSPLSRGRHGPPTVSTGKQGIRSNCGKEKVACAWRWNARLFSRLRNSGKSSLPRYFTAVTT
jgi:uridine phosphorylase